MRGIHAVDNDDGDAAILGTPWSTLEGHSISANVIGREAMMSGTNKSGFGTELQLVPFDEVDSGTLRCNSLTY